MKFRKAVGTLTEMAVDLEDRIAAVEAEKAAGERNLKHLDEWLAWARGLRDLLRNASQSCERLDALAPVAQESKPAPTKPAPTRRKSTPGQKLRRWGLDGDWADRSQEGVLRRWAQEHDGQVVIKDLVAFLLSIAWRGFTAPRTLQKSLSTRMSGLADFKRLRMGVYRQIVAPAERSSCWRRPPRQRWSRLRWPGQYGRTKPTSVRPTTGT